MYINICENMENAPSRALVVIFNEYIKQISA